MVINYKTRNNIIKNKLLLSFQNEISQTFMDYSYKGFRFDAGANPSIRDTESVIYVCGLYSK